MGHVWFVDANHVADPRAVGAPDDFPRAYDVAKRSTDGIADPHIAADGAPSTLRRTGSSQRRSHEGHKGERGMVCPLIIPCSRIHHKNHK